MFAVGDKMVWDTDDRKEHTGVLKEVISADTVPSEALITKYFGEVAVPVFCKPSKFYRYIVAETKDTPEGKAKNWIFSNHNGGLDFGLRKEE